MDRIFENELSNILQFPGSFKKDYFSLTNSNIFTLRNIIDYADAFDLGNDVLEHLNIDRDLLNLNGQKICIEAPSDALKLLKSDFDKHDFMKMGMMNAFELENQHFGQMLKSSLNNRDLYENLYHVISAIEENWDYKLLRRDQKSMVYESKPTEEMLDFHKKKDYSSEEILFFRQGFTSAIANYIDNPYAKVNILKSVHQGDSSDLFEIEF